MKALTVLLIADAVRVDVVCDLYAAAVCSIFSHVPDVKINEIERFKRLLHICGNDIGLRS